MLKTPTPDAHPIRHRHPIRLPVSGRLLLCALTLLLLDASHAHAQAPLDSGAYTITCTWQSGQARTCSYDGGAPQGARISRVTMTNFASVDAIVTGVRVGYGAAGGHEVLNAMFNERVRSVDIFAGSLASGRTWFIDLVGEYVGWYWATATFKFDWALWRRQPAPNDFDGDGRSDQLLVTRDGKWYLTLASGANPATIGIPWGWQWAGMDTYTHTLALGDYDGDGRTDRAIVAMRTGQWYIIPSSHPDDRGIPDIPWGWSWYQMGASHTLALGDYDGDGKTDRAIVMLATGQWWIIPSSRPWERGLPDIPWGWSWYQMGTQNALALGDYDGDGKTDRAIISRAEGRWYVIPSSHPDQRGLPEIPWGWQWPGMDARYQLAVGDYDGDGKTDRAIALRSSDSSTSTWTFSVKGSIAPAAAAVTWRFAPLPFDYVSVATGDYDGDGSVDPAVQAPFSGDIHYLTTR